MMPTSWKSAMQGGAGVGIRAIVQCNSKENIEHIGGSIQLQSCLFV